MPEVTMLKLEGLAYYAKVQEPAPDFNESQNPGTGKYQWEINIALEDADVDMLKDHGVNVGLKQAGGKSYTDKAVVLIKKWATDYNGNENTPPFVVDADKEEFFDPAKENEYIPNGSKVAVFWHPLTYGKRRYTTAYLDGVQVLEMATTSSQETNPTINMDEVPF